MMPRVLFPLAGTFSTCLLLESFVAQCYTQVLAGYHGSLNLAMEANVVGIFSFHGLHRDMRITLHLLALEPMSHSFSSLQCWEVQFLLFPFHLCITG